MLRFSVRLRTVANLPLFSGILAVLVFALFFDTQVAAQESDPQTDAPYNLIAAWSYYTDSEDGQRKKLVRLYWMGPTQDTSTITRYEITRWESWGEGYGEDKDFCDIKKIINYTSDDFVYPWENEKHLLYIDRDVVANPPMAGPDHDPDNNPIYYYYVKAVRSDGNSATSAHYVTMWLGSGLGSASRNPPDGCISPTPTPTATATLERTSRSVPTDGTESDSADTSKDPADENPPTQTDDTGNGNTDAPTPTATNTPEPVQVSQNIVPKSPDTVTPTPTPTETPTYTPEPTATNTSGTVNSQRESVTPTPVLQVGERSNRITHSPTPTPRATLTPVAVEKVDVTPVPGAYTIQPDESLTLTAGSVTIRFSIESLARTFQAKLEESRECGEDAPASATLTLYTAEGEAMRSAHLINPMQITIRLSAEQVGALGGPGVAFQTYALGGILFQVNDAVNTGRNNLLFELSREPDASFILVTETRAIRPIPLMICMSVDPDAQRMAHWQIYGTPTPTLASPALVITSSPTPMPEPAPPTTGDSSATLLSIMMALVAATVFLGLIVSILATGRLRP